MPASPELTQLSPPSTLLNIPPLVLPSGYVRPSPRYSVRGVFGSMTKVWGGSPVSPESIRFQFTPLSVLFNSPTQLTAYTVSEFCGSTIRSAKGTPGNCTELIVAQVAPPSVVLDTPPSYPAYRMFEFLGSIARLRTATSGKAKLFQLIPPSVLL